MKKPSIVIAHGDLDGIISTTLLIQKYGLKDPIIIFCQPFTVDKIKIESDVDYYVVDIAVNNRDVAMTETLIKALGDKLVIWYDHHQGWDGLQLPEKVFIINENVGSCAELIGGDRKLIEDAIAADTRQGQLSPTGLLIEQAIKADMSDDGVRRAAVDYLVTGNQEAKLKKAAKKYAAIQTETERLFITNEVIDGVAIVDATTGRVDYNATELLIKLQDIATLGVAIVRGKNHRTGEIVFTIARSNSKNYNLVNLFGLPSGAPFRVSIPETDWSLEKILEKLSSLSS